MRDVWIRGAGMTRFARQPEQGARELVEEAVGAALRDAEVDPRDVRAVYSGNAASGLMTGQECIRAQVALRRTPLMGVPIMNIENSCASSSTALHLAWQAVAGGVHDCVAVLGFEKIDHADRGKVGRAINATMDLGEIAEIHGRAAATERNLFGEMLSASSDPVSFGVLRTRLISASNFVTQEPIVAASSMWSLSVAKGGPPNALSRLLDCCHAARMGRYRVSP